MGSPAEVAEETTAELLDMVVLDCAAACASKSIQFENQILGSCGRGDLQAKAHRGKGLRIASKVQILGFKIYVACSVLALQIYGAVNGILIYLRSLHLHKAPAIPSLVWVVPL